MRYFILLDFQHMVLAFFLGLLAVLFVYLAWRDYPEQEAEEHPGEELASGQGSSSHPMPPLLVLVYVGGVHVQLSVVGGVSSQRRLD